MSARAPKKRSVSSHRPPTRRRSRGPGATRPRKRRPGTRGRRADDRSVRPLVLAALSVTAAVAVVNWLLAHGWVLVVLGVLVLSACGVRIHRGRRRSRWEAVRARGLRYELSQLDGLHHSQFEAAVRDLMHRDGCRGAVRVGGGGDLGADVKATDPYGRRWVIQCKHRRHGLAGSAVGTPDFQVLNGTARQVHGADVAVIVTNGRVTAPAVAFAAQQRLHVVDRHTLAAWASGSRPLWELLRAVPPPRKPTALS